MAPRTAQNMARLKEVVRSSKLFLRKYAMMIMVVVLLVHVVVFDLALLIFVSKASSAANKVEELIPVQQVLASLDLGNSELGLGRIFEDVLPEQYLLAVHTIYHHFVRAVHRFATVDVNTGAVHQLIYDTSTNREFVLIMRRMQERGLTPTDSERLVVDIGTMDGISGSNSFNFVAIGWHGVLVEPFPRHFERILRNHEDYLNVRTQRVIPVNAVVSDRDGTIPLALYSSHSKTSNTVVPDMNRNKVPSEIIDVRSYTPASLAQAFNIPKSFAVLTVDAEGIDDTIVRLFVEAGFRPWFVILELRDDYVDFSDRPDEFLLTFGYKEMAVAGSNVIWELSQVR